MTEAPPTRPPEDNSDESFRLLPDPLVLPNEVISRIIQYLRDDMNTLATCMRVSNTIHHITIPHLYRNGLILNEHNPFSLPSSTTKLESRISPSKETNLERIRAATFIEHEIDSCPKPCPESLTTKFPIDTLRIQHIPRTAYHVASADHLEVHLEQCWMMKKFSPKKLVRWFDEDLFELDARLDWLVSTEVTIMSAFWSTGWLVSPVHQPMSLNPSTSVYILWTPNPSVRFRCEVSEGQRDAGSTIQCCLESVAHDYDYGDGGCCVDDLLSSVALKNHANEIIIVNAGNITPSELRLAVGSSAAIVQDTFEALFRKRLTRFKAEKHEGRLGPLYRNRAEVDLMKFKFISLREYLKTYDWTGEFTDEEVMPWLEEVEGTGSDGAGDENEE